MVPTEVHLPVIAWSKTFAALTTTSIVFSATCSEARAGGAYPGTGAPLAAASRLTPEGDKTNPFAYPFLMEIAKSLAKNGLPPGFFLQGDSKSTASSIDLRAILLFEAGILKAPVRLLMPPKKKEEKTPSLSLPSIPESGQQFPGDDKLGLAPSPAPEPTVTADAARPRLSLDFDRFQLELTKPQNKNELVEPGKGKGKELAMTVSAKTPVLSDRNTFRLWTLRKDGPPLSQISIKNQQRTDNYLGSFIVTAPGAIRSIEGRLFFLKQGELLVSSRGKALVLDAPRSQVIVNPGSSVAVDTNGKGLLEIKVLETTESSVAVKFKLKGGLEELRLSAGEQLVLSDQPLTSGDKALLSNPMPGPGNHAETWAKGKFSPAGFADKSSLFKGDALFPSQEFRSAVKSLRGRLR